MPAQPNILFIMSDQHRGDCLSLEDHPVMMTPHLDGIGLQGAHFRRAYSTCPSCIPARRALLTGQYPQTNGMVGFISGVPIADDTVTMPQALREGGYQTELIGRTMHQEPPTRRYGYDHMTLGSTYVRDDVYAHEMAAHGDDDVRGAGITNNGWTARPWHLDEAQHPTNWVVSRARRFMQREHDATAPLFLNVSFYAPHPPLIPPQCYLDRYLQAPTVPPFIGDWATPPDRFLVDSARVNLTGEALRWARAGYYGLINHIDDQLYWLMVEFKEMSHRDGREWLIVYSTDHGEMLGDHYYFRKCEPYEGSARIPLLICGSPGLGFHPRTTCETPVCLEDLMPTLLDAAGLPCPAGVDGRSLLPILRGETTAVREVLHGEHSPCYSREQAHHYLTDGRWKYIWRPFTGEEQLFDLQADPGECRNLAAAPGGAAETTRWRNELIARLAEREEGFTDGMQLHEPSAYPGILQHGATICR